MHTQVAIIGAGPAGLVLAQLLSREGIESVVLERADRAFLEQRLRAGLLEPGTVRRIAEIGVDARLREQGGAHDLMKFRFEGRTYPLDLRQHTGKQVTTYPQQDLVKDLIAARIAGGGDLRFEVSDLTLHDVRDKPTVRFHHGGADIELHCDVIAGCDGFHGASRAAIPAEELITYEHDYPFGWLGILAEAPPSDSTGIYCYHKRGFALASLRGTNRSRHYLQVDLADTLEEWPDERIWEELDLRMHSDEPGWTLNRGPILDKSITPLRGFVAEPMRYGRLFLAGDAAHIVPPTGAKGLNLAVADAWTLGLALAVWYRDADPSGLDAYSTTCLRRAWRRIAFSIEMTELLHAMPSDSPALDHRIRLSNLDYLVNSAAARTSLAENYVGFELE